VDLNEMVVFARVVQTGSFTKAGAELGMPKSTVSRKITELEARLGARLLQRTTRKLGLTDAGRTYYDHCARIVVEMEEAERAVGSLQSAPRGLLRVTAPADFRVLGPIVGEYLRRYPEVRLELVCTGRRVDLVEERFDLGIRAGTLADSSLVSRKLGTAEWWLVATPGYLKRRGRPKAPADLAGHDCLLFGNTPDALRLHLRRAGESVDLDLSPRLVVGDNDILHDVVRAGHGIALLPVYLCVEDLRARRLERVLREWDAPATPVHVVYPSTRHLSPKVKSFVDHLQAQMNPPPWEIDREG
jgi:DNA-binding transcriptional LysR family regulator